MNKIELQDPTKPYEVGDLFAKLGIPMAAPRGPSMASAASRGISGSLLDVVCVDGERTQHLTRICGSYIGKGIAEAEVTRICLDWNARNNPPLDDAKVRSTVRNIMRTHQRNHPSSTSPGDKGTPLFDLADARVTNLLRTSAPARVWLLKDCLPLGRVGLIVAPGGTGKSQFLLQLGISVATGIDLAEHWKVGLSGGVLLLFAEDEIDEVHRRFEHAMVEIVKLDPNAEPTLEHRLFIKSMVGTANYMTCVQNSGGVVPTDYADRLILVAKQIPDLRLVVIDPASRFRGGSENVAEDVTRFVEEVERIAVETGATVLIAHHVNKASAGARDQSQNAARGSSALTDGVRWQMNMAKLTEGKAEKLGLPPALLHKLVLVEVTKNNYGPPQAEVVLERLDGGYLRDIRAAGQPVTLEDRIVALIRSEEYAGRIYSTNKFEEEFGGQEKLLKAGVGTIRTAIGKLVKDKRLHHVGSGNQRKLRFGDGQVNFKLDVVRRDPPVEVHDTKTGTDPLDGSSMLDASMAGENSVDEKPVIGETGPNLLAARRIEHREAALINQGVTFDAALYKIDRPSRGGSNLKNGSSADSRPPVPPLTVDELAWLVADRFGGVFVVDHPSFPAHQAAQIELYATLNGPGTSDDQRLAARARIAGNPVHAYRIRLDGEAQDTQVFAHNADPAAVKELVAKGYGKHVEEITIGESNFKTGVKSPSPETSEPSELPGDSK